MVKLFCALVGALGGNAFPVDIDENESVGDLKDAVKAKNPNRITCAARDLEVYLAKKKKKKKKDADDGHGDRWLTDDEVAEGGTAITNGLRHLRPLSTLRRVGLSEAAVKQAVDQQDEEEQEEETHHLHVVVVVPPLAPPLFHYREIIVDGVRLVVTPSMKMNPPPLVAFWKALLASTTEIKADALVTLPQATYLLGDPSLGSSVYIRHCYAPLLALSLELIHDPVTRTPHLVVLGNPGIGKTFFGFVILLHLARTRETVVYEYEERSGGARKRLLFSRDTVVIQGSQQDFIAILDQPATYYIVDGVKPPYYSAKTILLTSPRRSVWYEFNKTNCQSRCMPVWSKDEILTCRALMYPELPVDVVEDRLYRWGGIPRYVLRKDDQQYQSCLLEQAIANVVDLKWLLDACCGQRPLMNENGQAATFVSMLFHYLPNEQFTSELLALASQYVQQQLYKRLYEQDPQKLLEFLGASAWSRGVAKLQIDLSEAHAHFHQGGERTVDS